MTHDYKCNGTTTSFAALADTRPRARCSANTCPSTPTTSSCTS